MNTCIPLPVIAITFACIFAVYLLANEHEDPSLWKLKKVVLFLLAALFLLVNIGTLAGFYTSKLIGWWEYDWQTVVLSTIAGVGSWYVLFQAFGLL